MSECFPAPAFGAWLLHRPPSRLHRTLLVLVDLKQKHRNRIKPRKKRQNATFSSLRALRRRGQTTDAQGRRLWGREVWIDWIEDRWTYWLGMYLEYEDLLSETLNSRLLSLPSRQPSRDMLSNIWTYTSTPLHLFRIKDSFASPDNTSKVSMTKTPLTGLTILHRVINCN